MTPALEAQLRRMSRPAELGEALEDGKVRCLACGHGCVIAEGSSGICRVRFNRAGRLYAPYGYTAGLAADPIEKKPFFHVLPGARALSFGMLGCNFSCRFCQNWISSQALRDPEAGAGVRECAPEDLVEEALQARCQVVVSTYNEPLITSEWAAAVFRKAKAAGLRCGFVSNGHASRGALDYLRPCLDFYKVDLKCFDEGRYRQVMGGSLKHVLRTISDLAGMGVWVEVVTLVIPGFNDSDPELKAIAGFIKGVSPDIPWHVTAYHPDFKMADSRPTPPETLERAAAIGKAAGLRFVYAGNLPGETKDLEDTFCPSCRTRLIERRGFRVLSNRLKNGSCPDCKAVVPGVWATSHS